MALTPRAAKRRFFLTAAVLIFTVTAAAVFTVTLAERSRVRLDLTATRQHALSPRTLSVLRSLSAPYEIVVVADYAAVSPQARTAMGDVLDEFTRASTRVRVTTIDAGRPDQETRFVELLDRLGALYADDTARRADATHDAEASLHRASALLTEAAEDLRGAPDAESLAATLRVRARDAASSADAVAAAAQERILGSTLAPLDEALTAARAAIDAIGADVSAAIGRLGTLAQQNPEAHRVGARALSACRDELATTGHTLAELGPSELYAVVRALQRDHAVVVFSPAGATAVSFSALFPSGAAGGTDDRGVSTFRFVGEELLTTAIASLANHTRPIVVLTHPWPVRLLDDAGAPNPAAGPLSVAGLVDRLRLRGIDAAEWPVGDQPEPPDLSSLDPAGDRPVVWAVLGTVGASGDTAVRNGALANAITRLLDSGASMLLSYSPSTLPGAGSPDVLAEPLEALGVTVDSGRPLLRRVRTPRETTVDPGLTLTHTTGSHPIARAADGLAIRFGWAVPLELDPPAGVTASPLLQIEPSPDIWAESQWFELWSTPSNARRRLRTPEPTPGLDGTAGPWVLAAAVERASPTTPGATQRLVVVGATAWFFDASILPARRIDGRVAAAYPGNGELFDSSVAWLAGLDDLIAPGAVARDIPRIQPVAPSALRLLRWSLAIGPAAGVLLFGAALRMIRG